MKKSPGSRFGIYEKPIGYGWISNEKIFGGSFQSPQKRCMHFPGLQPGEISGKEISSEWDYIGYMNPFEPLVSSVEPYQYAREF